MVVLTNKLTIWGYQSHKWPHICLHNHLTFSTTSFVFWPTLTDLWAIRQVLHTTQGMLTFPEHLGSLFLTMLTVRIVRDLVFSVVFLCISLFVVVSSFFSFGLAVLFNCDSSSLYWYLLFYMVTMKLLHNMWYRMVRINLLQCGMKCSQWIYLHVVRNGHNESTTFGIKWSQWIYFHVVWNSHNKYTSIMSIWHKVVIIYQLTCGTKL